MSNPTPSASPDLATRALDADLNGTTGSSGDGTLTITRSVSTPRYEFGEEIARGGMGEVYRATDTVLDREVAVKVLQAKYGPDSGAARRFADEARITGQLQHPAIPPVHDLGKLPDGRPFLAMKLIKGDTLDELLKRRTDPSQNRGQFVAVFEAVCQAVAYAHAHNVIHRDLKPANVMVGAFGEVQVMDWGLAKVLTANRASDGASDPLETAAATEVRSLRESDGSFTQAGSVLGTPAFMPPEQAVGAIGKVDARSDVFGLGAILAVVLTGLPPFAASSAETTRVKAAQGDVADCFARLDGCGADPELVALCQRCLSPKSTDRPADAGAVAKAVAAFRVAADERARKAELDRVRAEGETAAAELKAAEQRRRGRLRLALALTVGVMLLGGGAVAWWQDREAAVRRIDGETRARDERERLDRNADAVAGLLAQCDDALRAGDAARAEVSLAAAEKRSAEGGTDAHALRLTRCVADLAVLRELDAISQYEWTETDGRFPTWKQLAGRYRAAFARFGVDADTISANDAARRIADSAVRDRLVSTLDGWLQGENSAWVQAVLRAADPDEFRDAVRDATLAKDAAGLATLAARTETLAQPPGFLAVFGQDTDVPVARRREAVTGAVRRRPGDLVLLMVLGRIASNESDWKDALRWYQAAVAVAPANPTTHLRVGNTLQKLENYRAAEQCFREAFRLSPADREVRFALGTILLYRPDGVVEGIGHLREAVRAKPEEPRYHCNLAHLLRENGEYQDALAEMRAGHALSRRDLEWEYPSAKWVEECERLAALDEKRALVVEKKAKPKDAAEMFEFARISRAQKRYAEATRFYQDGFEAEFVRLDGTALMRDKIAAAGAAVLSCRAGIDPLPLSEHAAARAQAREWLDEILSPLKFMSTLPNAPPSARTNIQTHVVGLLENPDFRGVRDADVLAALPKPEADKWSAFWDDLRQLRARTMPLELAPNPRRAK